MGIYILKVTSISENENFEILIELGIIFHLTIVGHIFEFCEKCIL